MQSLAQAYTVATESDTPSLTIQWINSSIKHYILRDIKLTTLDILASEYDKHYHQIEERGGEDALVIIELKGELLSPRNLIHTPELTKFMKRIESSKPSNVIDRTFIVTKSKLVRNITKRIINKVYPEDLPYKAQVVESIEEAINNYYNQEKNKLI